MAASPGSSAHPLPAPSRGRALRFALVFGLLSVTLLGFYYFPYPDRSPIKPWLDAFLHRYAASAGFVLRLFEPGVQVVGTDIIGRFSLHIVKTCDAMDVTILLVSAILAWPSSWRRRLAGAIGAILFLYVLNVLRICSLYYIGILWPSFFEVAHLDVWPALILVVAVGFFFALTVWRGPATSEDSNEPA